MNNPEDVDIGRFAGVSHPQASVFCPAPRPDSPEYSQPPTFPIWQAAGVNKPALPAASRASMTARKRRDFPQKLLLVKRSASRF